MSLYTIERFDSKPWPDDQLETLFSEGFPPFISADPVAHSYIDRVWEWFAEYNLVLLDAVGQLTAAGWAVPLSWNGEVTDLPSGYTDALRRAVMDHETSAPVNTLVICAGIVHPQQTRQGVAKELVGALCNLCADTPLTRVIAPVRPTLKHLYPLTPIETFARWVGPDNLPLDPWIRSHVRMGGQIIAMAPHSQTMIGSIEQWETWTGRQYPSTGHYIIPQGLSPLYIDREQNLGRYTEPNVWIQHRTEREHE